MKLTNKGFNNCNIGKNYGSKKAIINKLIIALK